MLAEEIFRQVNKEAKANRVTTENMVCHCKETIYSRLNKSKLIDNGFKPLPDWKDALEDI